MKNRHVGTDARVKGIASVLIAAVCWVGLQTGCGSKGGGPTAPGTGGAFAGSGGGPGSSGGSGGAGSGNTGGAVGSGGSSASGGGSATGGRGGSGGGSATGGASASGGAGGGLIYCVYPNTVTGNTIWINKRNLAQDICYLVVLVEGTRPAQPGLTVPAGWGLDKAYVRACSTTPYSVNATAVTGVVEFSGSVGEGLPASIPARVNADVVLTFPPTDAAAIQSTERIQAQNLDVFVGCP